MNLVYCNLVVCLMALWVSLQVGVEPLCKLECLAGILLHPEQVKVSLIDSLAFCSALYANQNEKCNTTRNIKFKRKMTSDTYKIKS